jgi:hypothetical protein
MNKNEMLKSVNLVLALSFIVQALTGLCIFFALKGEFMEIIEESHKYNGLILLLAALAHIYLNWGWIKNTYLKVR